jgi:hypothetical protein
MKRIVISILLATVFASIPVFAKFREAHPNGLATEVTSANLAGASLPQFRRRHRRRRYVIVRRHLRRHDRRIYVMRRGRLRR